MITRYYICDKCGHELSIRQELHDEKRLKKCPACKKHALYQDLTGQHSYVYGEPTTVIHQADRNASKAGKYELEAKRREAKISKDKPRLERLKKAGLIKESAEEVPEKKPVWYNPERKNLAKELEPVLKSKTKMRKYIKDGKIE